MFSKEELIQLFGTWHNIVPINDELTIFENLDDIYPEPSQIFEPFQKCDLDKLKVVILCDNFTHPTTKEITYRVIQDKLRDYYEDENLCFNGFDEWYAQGVMLLSPFTCKKHDASSHNELWRSFIQKILNNLMYRDFYVYLVWGDYARSFKLSEFGNKILESNSPIESDTGLVTFDPHFESVNNIYNFLNNSTISWVTQKIQK